MSGLAGVLVSGGGCWFRGRVVVSVVGGMVGVGYGLLSEGSQ